MPTPHKHSSADVTGLEAIVAQEVEDYLIANPPTASAEWGDIAGTLADQTDLQDALDGKAAATHLHPVLGAKTTGAQAVNNTETNLLEIGPFVVGTGEKVKLDAYCEIVKDNNTTARPNLSLRIRRKAGSGVSSGDTLIAEGRGQPPSIANCPMNIALAGVVDAPAAGTYYYALMGVNGQAVNISFEDKAISGELRS